MIYRGNHYCGNEKFTQNFIEMFKARDQKLLSNEIVYNTNFISTLKSHTLMDTFVDQVENHNFEGTPVFKHNLNQSLVMMTDENNSNYSRSILKQDSSFKRN